MQCLTPFPDDFFTTPDPSRPTGHRLNYSRDMMPVNVMGVHVDPTDINRSDGFSPGSSIIVRVPGIDLAQTGAAPITDIARSLDRGRTDRAARHRRPAHAFRTGRSSTRGTPTSRHGRW